MLCVLAADEITDDAPAGADGRLPAVTVASAASLPLLDQSWAWAHVQVDAYDPATESIATVVDASPLRARSRLLAPRHLLPRTAYTAMLVPAFERGRLAGLREPVPDSVDGLAAAWAAGATAIRLPVYYRWSFQTGDQADFEQLARRLTARAADPSTGVFTLDARTPDPALPAASADPMTGTGALAAPAATSSPWPATERGPFVGALAAMLNQPADLLDHAGGEPLVAPPLWVRWQAATDRLDPTDGATPAWFQELNADPRLRVAAGLGAEVIRRNDDALMAAAWDQVAGILAANAQMRRAQLAREASVRLLTNHLSTLDQDMLVQVTAPLHAHLTAAAAIPASSSTSAVATATVATIHERLRASPIPPGALDGQLRRLRRPAVAAGAVAVRRGGAASRRCAGAASGGRAAARRRPGAVGFSAARRPAAPAPSLDTAGGLLDRLNRGVLRARPPVPTPDTMLVLTAEAPPGRLPIVDIGGLDIGGLAGGVIRAVAPRLPSQPGPG